MKAVALFSGGLDSALAIKLVQKQGIEVVAVKFIIPFAKLGNYEKDLELAKKLNVELKIIELGQDYLEIIKNPKYGYGKNINPCIDCKAFMLKKAKQYADEIGADFLVTGEVLAQRPMSQKGHQLKLIEKESELTGKILRPLSAQILPQTLIDVNIDSLEKIHGRGRNRQLELAKEFGLEGFLFGTGGCELTQKTFAIRVRDLLININNVTIDDVKLLRSGRYFRIDKTIVIVGRNLEQNKMLLSLKKEDDVLFDMPYVPGPIALTRGNVNENIIKIVSGLVARYSDVETGKEHEVFYGINFENKIKVKPLTEEEIAISVNFK